MPPRRRRRRRRGICDVSLFPKLQKINIYITQHTSWDFYPSLGPWEGGHERVQQPSTHLNVLPLDYGSDLHIWNHRSSRHLSAKEWPPASNCLDSQIFPLFFSPWCRDLEKKRKKREANQREEKYIYFFFQPLLQTNKSRERRHRFIIEWTGRGWVGLISIRIGGISITMVDVTAVCAALWKFSA